MNYRQSRSRSPRVRRKDPRRSPPPQQQQHQQQQQERGAYQRRSNSRSGSRDRRDMGKRRSRFSDQNGGGSGFEQGGFSHHQGGFDHPGNVATSASNYNYGGNQQGQQYDDSMLQIRMPDSQQPQHSFSSSSAAAPPSSGSFSATFHQTKTTDNNGIISISNGDFDTNYITINNNSSSGSSMRTQQKISRKVYIPQDNKFNYIGLIIGPRGANQKQLEEDTNCKILIRGRGSQKSGLSTGATDENEDLHVLIEADSEANAVKAMREVENIIFMDDDEKARKRDSQLRSAHSQGIGSGRMNEFSGDPEKHNFIVVPNTCVGLVIGRKGDMIKQIRDRAGAEKVYMQSEANRNLEGEFQNLIVEGGPEAVEKVREIINDIILQQRRKQGGGHSGPRVEMEIPTNMAGLIIGKQGSTLLQVGQQTRTHCSMQQNNNTPDDAKKYLIITGNSDEDCQQAKAIFEEKMNARANQLANPGPPRFGGGGGGYGMPPPYGGRGGYQSSGPRGGGGMPGRQPFRRGKRNADGDEIVDDAYQYDYYQDPAAMMQMGNPMYMGYNPQMYQQQQQLYPSGGDQYYQQQQQHQQPPPTHESTPGTAPPDQMKQMYQASSEQAQQDQQQQQQGQNPGQGESGGYDPMQMQMQLQYQQMMMQQMYMNQNQAPVIEEVLADGTIITRSFDGGDDEERRRGRRGGGESRRR